MIPTDTEKEILSQAVDYLEEDNSKLRMVFKLDAKQHDIVMVREHFNNMAKEKAK